MSEDFQRSSVLKIAFEELERARFLKTTDNKIAVRIGNNALAPLYVTNVDDNNLSSIDVSYYEKAELVPKLVETLVAMYLVPVGKIFNLDHIEASGENTAKYTIKINGQVNKVKYTYYGAPLNVDFNYNSYSLPASTLITVHVEHFINNGPVDFHATIEGRLQDE